MAVSHHPQKSSLLPLPHVQFWQTENRRRLDSSRGGGHRRDIPGLVDASDVRAVEALEKPRARFEGAALFTGAESRAISWGLPAQP